MAGFASLVLRPVTHNFITCGWYGIVGGLVSVFQLAAAAGIDASIESHRLMPKVELAKNALVAGTFDATDAEQSNLVSADLRASSTVIEGELEAYESNPESRYFYICGVRVATVLNTVGLLLASQAVTLFEFGLTHVTPLVGSPTRVNYSPESRLAPQGGLLCSEGAGVRGRRSVARSDLARVVEGGVGLRYEK